MLHELKNLEGRRIAVLAADGFERVELAVPVKALRAAGADVEILSLRNGRIRGVNLHEPASRVKVDRLVKDAIPYAYDGLLIPGGLIGPDILRQSKEAREFVRTFDEAGKPIAVICHGPWLLISAELVGGRVMTSWPGIRDDVVNAGATWLDDSVVRDRNWVSSRGPQDLAPFVAAMLDLFARGLSFSDRPVASVSEPRHDEPPKAMLKAIQWMPRPSFRTALGFIAIGAGIVAFSKKRKPRSRTRIQEYSRAAA
jgi:protease I